MKVCLATQRQRAVSHGTLHNIRNQTICLSGLKDKAGFFSTQVCVYFDLLVTHYTNKVTKPITTENCEQL
jgi:hypothetical protein